MQAWLRLTPDGAHSTNGARFDVPLPEIHDDYSHLPAFLDDAGRTVATGFGHAPLSFGELRAWAQGTGIDLSGFEMQALRDMSEHYASVANRPDADCPSALGDEARAVIDEAAHETWDALERELG